MLSMSSVRDNAALRRFELDAEGQIAFATYRRADGVITFTHTETPRALRGRGIASALIRGALEIARTEGAKVRALCPFVSDYIARHPEFADLLA
jgi:predicted GNAT family acetyltransferase